MREIIFRGKRLDNGEWVYGDFVNDWSKQNTKPDKTICNNIGKYAVISETIGQYTGLKDVSGKMIFEGDIVHITGNPDVPDWADLDYNATIIFKDGGFCAVNGTPEHYFIRRYDLCRFDFDLAVIGNIHDNPELIGGT
ncbi:MAG: hypothetical protein IKY90_08885 [Oscillospiraceae bacterium]|nr:hypothetical protein [Oscillospiraceae bacterium]